MQVKMLYCSECGFVTEHQVVNHDGLMVRFCQQCIIRWAREREEPAASDKQPRAKSFKQA